MKKESDFLYSKLAGQLRERIVSGYIKPGEYLKPENKLAAQFGMSRVSVRAALDILQNEGYIEKRKGQGSVVLDYLHKDSSVETIDILCTYPSFYAESALQEVIRTFEASHEGVRVNIIYVPFQHFYQCFNTDHEGALSADLYLLASDQLHSVVKPERFFDLPRLLTEDVWNTRMCGCLTRVFWDDPYRFAMPISISSIFLAFDRKMLRERGVGMPPDGLTLHTLRLMMQKLMQDRNGDGVTDCYGLSLASHPSRWISVASALGVDFQCIEKSRETLESVLSWFHEMLFHDRSAIAYADAGSMSNPFYLGHAAFAITSALEVAGWLQNGYCGELGVVDLPGNEVGVPLAVANCLAMNANSAKRELALDFVRTSVDESVQKRVARKYGFPSVYTNVNTEVWENEDDFNMNRVLKGLDRARFITDILQDEDAISICDAETRLFWMGLESARETAKKIVHIFKE